MNADACLWNQVCAAERIATTLLGIRWSPAFSARQEDERYAKKLQRLADYERAHSLSTPRPLNRMTHVKSASAQSIAGRRSVVVDNIVVRESALDWKTLQSGSLIVLFHAVKICGAMKEITFMMWLEVCERHFGNKHVTDELSNPRVGDFSQEETSEFDREHLEVISHFELYVLRLKLIDLPFEVVRCVEPQLNRSSDIPSCQNFVFNSILSETSCRIFLFG